MIKKIYEYDDIIKNIEFIFKGGYYKVKMVVFKDCLQFLNLLYVCDNINKENIVNREVKSFETEYKQIYEILKKEYCLID